MNKNEKPSEERGNFFRKLERIDRRFLYGIIFAFSILSFFVKIPLKNQLGPELEDVYKAVDSCPGDKVILVDSSWDEGSMAENKPQFEVVVRHMMKRGIKFVIISVGVTPKAPDFAQRICKRLEREYGRKYGVDWVNLGYIQTSGVGVVLAGHGFVIDAMAKDIHRIFPEDYYGTPVQDMPIMKRVRDINDVHLVFACTYAPTEEWLSFIKGQYGVPVAFAGMSIMAPYYYPYLDSKQLVGIMVGIRGAAEYESKIRVYERGSRLMVPQAFAHILIILFILFGNVAYFASRRKG